MPLQGAKHEKWLQRLSRYDDANFSSRHDLSVEDIITRRVDLGQMTLGCQASIQCAGRGQKACLNAEAIMIYGDGQGLLDSHAHFYAFEVHWWLHFMTMRPRWNYYDYAILSLRHFIFMPHYDEEVTGHLIFDDKLLREASDYFNLYYGLKFHVASSSL